MEILLIFLLIVGIGLNDVLCFFIGAKVVQNVKNNKEIKIPLVNQVEKIKESFTTNKDNQEFEKEYQDLMTSLENIDNYGSERAQKNIN